MIALLLSLCQAAESPAPQKLEPVWTLVMPLGVPQLVQHRRPRALVYGSLQVVGIGVATWSSLEMWQALEAEDFERELQMRMISAGGVAFASAAWFGSVLDASNQYQQRKEMISRAQAWERARVEAVADSEP